MKFNKEDDLVTIEILNEEDLWYLSLIMKEGDRILADVLRRVERKTDSIRNKKTEREKIGVRIRVENVEFMELSERIHVLGQIEWGPEDFIGEHQSINIEKGSFVKVIPSDEKSFIKNIEESSSLSNISIPVLSVDDENITFYEISESGNELIWRIPTGMGKMYETKEEQHRDEFLEKMESYRKSSIYVLGPSIFRDSTSKLLSQSKFTIINTQVSSSEEEGIRELLQEGEVNLRRSEENKLVSDFLKRVNNATASYGLIPVDHFLDIRAVDTLLISDRFFREKNSSRYMEKCTEGGCKVFVVHSSWETGKIIESFGGVAAILRYRVAQ